MIRFPQQPMADSVVERIMKIAQTQQIAPVDTVKTQGAQLDAALQAPIGDVAPLDGIENAIATRSLGL